MQVYAMAQNSLQHAQHHIERTAGSIQCHGQAPLQVTRPDSPWQYKYYPPSPHLILILILLISSSHLINISVSLLAFHTLSCILLSPDDLSLTPLKGLYITNSKHAIPNPRCSVFRGFRFCCSCSCSSWCVYLPITLSTTSFPSTYAEG